MAPPRKLTVDEVSFSSFFEAITGHLPYVWQDRAAESLLAGTPPAVIAAPTGMGKTALVVAWAWALAQDVKRSRAEGTPRRVPLRYVAVIDRRVVVDATADLSSRLATLLNTATPGESHPAIVKVATQLRELSGLALEVRVLRGGLEVRPEGPRNPAAPTVVVGTIDLVGSRLLWRGYGVSPRRRPIDAAMVGIDSLFVLDEAHLAAQFETTLGVLDRHVQHSPLVRVPGRQLVVMTATPKEPADRFDWTVEIEHNPALAARRQNRRGMPVEVIAGADGGDKKVAEWLQTAMSPEQCVVAFFNTAKAARDAVSRLRARKDFGDRDVVLLIGGMPDLARTAALASIEPYLSGRDRAGAQPVLICATQTLEVGADLDADVLVTPVASVAALIQRLGRVNRIGARTQGRVIVVASLKPDPVYPCAQTLAELLSDDAPGTMGELEDVLAAIPLDEEVPVAVMPRHVFENYLRTGGSPNEPDVGRWLRSPQDDRVQIQVAFRDAVRLLDDDTALAAHLDRWPPRPEEIWTLAGNGDDLVWSSAKAGRIAVVDGGQGTPTRVIERRPDQFRPGDVYVIAPIADKKMPLPGWGTDLLATLPNDERPFLLDRVPTEDELGQTHAPADESPGDGELMEWVIRPIVNAQGQDTGWQERSPADIPRVEGRLAGEQYPLSSHQDDVARRVRAWAGAVGLAEGLADDLFTAAVHHDDGKADPRFQRHLRMALTPDGLLDEAGTGGGLLAKSALPAGWWRRARRLAQVPDAWRHEAASAEVFDRLLAENTIQVNDAELVRHLIVTHHGYFRGLGPWLDGEDQPPAYQDPRRPEWLAQDATFTILNERYGPYALALMESIVRLADWFESEAR